MAQDDGPRLSVPKSVDELRKSQFYHSVNTSSLETISVWEDFYCNLSEGGKVLIFGVCIYEASPGFLPTVLREVPSTCFLNYTHV